MSPPRWNKAAHSGLETQRRRHQKFKTGVSVAPQKRTYVFQKDFLKTFFRILHFSADNPGLSAGLGGGAGGEGSTGFVLEQHARQHLPLQ